MPDCEITLTYHAIQLNFPGFPRYKPYANPHADRAKSGIAHSLPYANTVQTVHKEDFRMTFQKKTIRRFMTLGALVSATALSLSMTACDDGGDADGGAGMGGAETGGTTGSGGGSTTGGSAATGGTGGEAPAADDIVDIASDNEDFSILVAAVTKAGLVEALRGDDLTVFAPTNAAFEALFEAIGVDGIDDLSAEQLRPILLYHVVAGVVDSTAATDIAEDEGQFGALGGTVKIAVEDGGLVLDGGATVTTADVEASNGLIHIIDAVLLPSITDIVVSNEEFESLKTLVLAADGAEGTDPKVAELLDAPNATAETEGKFTLFAPSNEAVGAVPPEAVPSGQNLTTLLAYHVIDGQVLAAAALEIGANTSQPTRAGESFTISGGSGVSIAEGIGGVSNVVITDILAENGVIHVIDKVLLPPSLD